MADIEIVYESSHRCYVGKKDYCGQCHTPVARDLGCEGYYNGDYRDKNLLPCENATTVYSRIGWSGKKYEIQDYYEDGADMLNQAESINVKLGDKWYFECVKVILNGKVIFNHYDDEE